MTITAPVDAQLTWRYQDDRDGTLVILRHRAVASVWDVDTAIDWSAEVAAGPGASTGRTAAMPSAPIPTGFPLPPERYPEFTWEYHVWLTSQFLHGEQGALLSAARLVESLPSLDAKLLAASQATDEARHVEVYRRYLHDKLGTERTVNASLAELLRQILADSRWDLVALGMQVIVEGLALAAFRLSAHHHADAVIATITRLVAQDEARHVAFGVAALSEVYEGLTSGERREREDFVLEAVALMSKRFELSEVWERLGVAARDGRRFLLTDPDMVTFRRLLFTRVMNGIEAVGLRSERMDDSLAGLGIDVPRRPRCAGLVRVCGHR